MTLPTYFTSDGKNLKKLNTITTVSDINLPSKKDNQQDFSNAKYRILNGRLSITFYGDKGYRIILKYNDAYKLKFRTLTTNKEGYETVLLTSYDLSNTNNTFENGNGSNHILYTVKIYARFGYKSEKVMLIQKVTKDTIISNDKSQSDIIEYIGINIDFSDFNETLNKIDSMGSLESISYSSSKLPNDVD